MAIFNCVSFSISSGIPFCAAAGWLDGAFVLPTNFLRGFLSSVIDVREREGNKQSILNNYNAFLYIGLPYRLQAVKSNPHSQIREGTCDRCARGRSRFLIAILPVAVEACYVKMDVAKAIQRDLLHSQWMPTG